MRRVDSPRSVSIQHMLARVSTRCYTGGMLTERDTHHANARAAGLVEGITVIRESAARLSRSS